MLDRNRWKIADELFEAALDVAPEEREAFLDARCDDPEIRAKVERLLASADSDVGFVSPGGAMEGPLGDALLQQGESAEDTAAEADADGDAVAETIEGFRLIRQVGEGGMGEVWEAEQLGAIRRRVAVKLVKAGLRSGEVLARFDSERAAVARMNQPNIARVYGGGSTATGRPYFAMEFVDGARITDYCDRRRLSVAERLALFVQVCEGVQHAHHKGIIHRDIKPSNVLMASEDGKPVPKIIDFGVARAIEAGTAAGEGMTEVGQVIGTPQYMSPEQTEVGAEEIDTRTDVYSLGVLLYELLVGVRPFELKEASSSSLIELRRQIRETDPLRPSRRYALLGEDAQQVAHARLTQASALGRVLRGDLDWIVVRCLEKDPSRRYASPHELASDIRRHLEGRPVLAGPPGVSYRLGKWVRRHRWASLAAAVAVIALVAGTVVSTLQARRAIRAEAAAQVEAETAQQVAAFLEQIFDGSDPGESPGENPRASDLLAAAQTRLQTELGDQPRVRARLLHAIGRIQRKLHNLEDAEPMLREAAEIRGEILGPSHPETIGSLIEISRLELETGDLDAAETTMRSALMRAENGEASQTPLHAEVASRLSGMLVDRGRLDEATEQQQAALTIRQRTLEPNDIAISNSRIILGQIEYQRANFEAAETHILRAVEIRKTSLGELHPDTALAMQNLAILYGRVGRDDEALPLLQRSQEILEQVFEPNHPEISRGLMTIATHLGRQGRVAESQEVLARAAKIAEAAFGPEHIRLAGLYGSMGLNYKILGNFDEAESYYLRSLAIVEANSDPNHWRIPWTLSRLASLSMAREEFDRARDYFARALSLLEQTHGVDHPEIADALGGLASVDLATGELQAAERRYRTAVTVVQQAHGDDFPNLAPQLEGLGETLFRQGREEESRTLLERARTLREKTGGTDHPAVANVLILLARLERASGKPAEAERLGREALRVSLATFGEDHLDAAEARQELAESLSQQGDEAVALSEAKQAHAIRRAKLPAGHSLVRESAATVRRLGG